jgi:hypothetical protein
VDSVRSIIDLIEEAVACVSLPPFRKTETDARFAPCRVCANHKSAHHTDMYHEHCDANFLEGLKEA